MTEAQNRDAWERARITAAIIIQPHVKKKLSPKQLLPMPWDKIKEKPRHEEPQLTAEEKRKRFESAVKRLS